MTRVLRSFLAVAAATLLAYAPAGAQQGSGTVVGQVTDAEAHRPIAEAQVMVVGTTRGARTDAEGRYRLTGVPAGTATLRVVRIGFKSTTQTVAVAPGSDVTANFELTTTPTILQTVITTAAGTQETRRESGASVSTINADSIPKAAVQNFSELVTARTPGVSVEQSTGTTGMGARIRIRGANSMTLSNEPLLIIDGVRIDNNAESNTIGVGGQTPSRLNDINPEDIADFQVIPGPAATALYGTAAANGVIQITTKHGQAGKTKWNLYSELGTIHDANDYPPNYGGWSTPTLYTFPGFEDPNAAGPTCNLVDEFYGNCHIDSLSTFNVIKTSHPFRTGHLQKIGGSVSGGTQAATYFFSGDAEQDAGIYVTNNLDRLNLRGNVTANPTDKLDFAVSTGYVQSGLQLPQNDNNYYGVMSNGLAGWPGPGPTQGYNPVPPSQFNQIDTRQDLDRFTGGVNSNWRPLSWLSGNATLGLDLVNRHDNETIPPNTVFFSNDNLGSRTSNLVRVLNLTSNYALTARYGITGRISGQSQAGYQFQEAKAQETDAFGRRLTAGTSSLSGTVQDKTVNESTVDNKTVGGFLSQQVNWNDKLYLTATLRADKNSAFGKNFGLITYPAVSLSYVALEGGDILSQLRLRTAFGESGLRPGVLDAFAYYQPAPARLNNADQAGITVGNLANPNLRAEKSKETEAGFDASLFKDRASVELTYYDKRSKDALVSRDLPPSLGGPASQFFNLGSVRNSGLELAVNAQPIQTRNYQLGLTLTASTNKNKLTKLGEGVPPIIFGWNQEHVEGYPLGGYWGSTIDSVKVQPDGSIIPDTLHVFFNQDPAKYRYLGSTLPTRQGSLSADLSLFKWIRVTTLFEHRGGNKLFNSTEQFRCLPFVAVCRGLNDKKAPVMERANAIADYLSNGAYFGGYIEDASFTKWRELAVTFSAPDYLASRIRASGLSLTLAGRNLYTWTKYTGLDPEVNVQGQSNFSQADFLTQPQVRYFTARLNVTF